MSIEGPELADGIRSADPEAQRRVVEAYLPQILRASRAAGLDAPAAEDVVQSTFLTFFEKAATFEGRSRVRTWLFGILYRKIQEESVLIFRARNRLRECLEAHGMSR